MEVLSNSSKLMPSKTLRKSNRNLSGYVPLIGICILLYLMHIILNLLMDMLICTRLDINIFGVRLLTRYFDRGLVLQTISTTGETGFTFLEFVRTR